MKYRKKPVVVEAFQMTKERRESNADWPNWLNQAWNKDFIDIGMVGCEDFPNSNGKDRLVLREIGGAVCTLSWGDWIVQGVQGEIYPCKPDIFEQTYEPAE